MRRPQTTVGWAWVVLAACASGSIAAGCDGTRATGMDDAGGAGADSGPAIVDAGPSEAPDAGPGAPDSGEPDAGLTPPAEPPTITIVSVTERVVRGQVGQVRFRLDGDAPWRLEAGGQAPGRGELLTEGDAEAAALVTATFASDALAFGEGTLRLYAGAGPSFASEAIRIEVVDTLSVLILHGAGTEVVADAELWQSALLADPRVESVERQHWVAGGGSVPALETLLGHDVVVYSYRYNETLDDGVRATLGTRIREYAAAGGAVVILGGGSTQGQPLGGILADGGLPLLRAGGGDFDVSPAELGVIDGAHPILDGVENLSAGSRARAALAEGAELVASWDDGLPLVATRGPIVGLTPVLRATDGELAGDWDTLLVNAVIWAFDQTAP